ncbi:MAG: signal peptidase I [Cyanobacteria bacterium P01_A01_bin.123]
MPDNFDPSSRSDADSPKPPSPNKPPKSGPNPWVEAVQTLGLSLVLAFGIRSCVAEARYIPSGSMLPTLQINDRLVIEKISYHFNPPVRGDIVVFWPPANALPEDERKDAFIKRVIGLPGEEVEVTDGQVIVDGTALEEGYIQAPPDYTWGPETVPSGEYLVLGDNRNSSYDSHAWGFVPKENIIGRAVVRFWPPNRLGGLD